MTSVPTPSAGMAAIWKIRVVDAAGIGCLLRCAGWSSCDGTQRRSAAASTRTTWQNDLCGYYVGAMCGDLACHRPELIQPRLPGPYPGPVAAYGASPQAASYRWVSRGDGPDKKIMPEAARCV